MRKVVIGYNWHWYCHGAFAAVLADQLACLIENGVEAVVDQERTLSPPRGQSILAERAHKVHNATHLIIMGDDTLAPKHASLRLLNWGLPVVGYEMSSRVLGPNRMPAHSTVVLEDGKLPTKLQREEFKKECQQGSPTRVKRVGSGFACYEIACLMGLPGPEPCFARGNGLSADFNLCDRLKKQGVDVYADFGMSGEIGHVGNHTFTTEELEDVTAETYYDPLMAAHGM